MTKKKQGLLTDVSFLIFTAVAVIGGILCYAKGQDVFLKGLDASWSLLVDIFSRMMGAFVLAGFVEVLVPKELINRWIGAKSGFRGIIVATLAGIVTPGGPMISFPLISALYRLGADAGPLVAYLTSWEILGVQRIIVWELPLMGLRFALLRFVVSLVLPVIAGVMARKLVLYVGGSFNVREG
ncbi:MAG: hypothetical protein A2170_05945 [Deltaproteobacteria bacterium RBG_13_53_10]|nr:MAG: hypothetical protein A2170_05945 [Deltaproteobacteria bacterium RBG_13_53_10]